MYLTLIGTSHKYLRLEERERFAFSSQDAILFSQSILRKGIARGVVVLSTCQRTEIYAESSDPVGLKHALFVFKDIKDKGISLCVLEDVLAIEHLFVVVSGLDSLIIGETEILHQVKCAYQQAEPYGATTPFLNRLFERALFVGKLVRSETAIGRKNPNLGEIAVARAEILSGGLDFKKTFVIGAGVVAQGVIRACAFRKNAVLIVANRTFDRAKILAQEFGGEAIRFDQFYRQMGSADVIFSATASPHVIIRKTDFTASVPWGRRVLIFDLAVPRDVDPAIGQHRGVRLINSDSLEQGVHFDTVSIRQAQEIVMEKAGSFVQKETLCLDASKFSPENFEADFGVHFARKDPLYAK